MKKSIALLVTGLIIMTLASACSSKEFAGFETISTDMYKVEYTMLNSTRTHKLTLNKGTSIDVVVANQTGELNLLVTDSHENVIYDGNYALSGVFSIEIPETDAYTFSVTGVGAQGVVSFTIAN
jgi:hypothetical protein